MNYLKLLAYIPLLGAIQAHALLVTVTDAVEELVTFTLTEDVSFEMTGSTFTPTIVFKEWLPVDSLANTRTLNPNRMYYKINDGVTQNSGQAVLYDYGSAQNGVAPGDGGIFTQPIMLTVGDHFTIVAQSWTLDLNQAQIIGDITETFSGNAYIVNGSSGNSISTVSAVPEPATYTAIFGAIVLSLSYWRRIYSKRRAD